jgi:DNA helicase HerA-like ATPase
MMKRFTVRPRYTSIREIRIGGTSGVGDYVLIGRLAEAGPVIPVTYDLNGEHVVAIVGKRGSGKSYTLGTLLEGLCTTIGKSPIGQISGKRAALLFDTLGIFQWTDIPLAPESTQEVIKRQFEVRKGWGLDVAPIKVSIWLPKIDDSKKLSSRHSEFTVRSSDLTASDWGYLLNLDILQDRMGQLLNDAYIKVTLEGWSDGSSHAPNQNYGIEDLVDCIRNDQELQTNYQSETIRAVIQQLTSFARNPLFRATGTDLHDLLRPGTLSVIVMNKMSDELRFILITSLIRKIMRARIESSELEKDLAIRSDITEPDKYEAEKVLTSGIPPCWVAADEAQNFLPVERRTSAADILVRLVREGRNYGLSFAITTQQPTAIDARIMSQVDTLIAHKLTVQSDIEYVRRNLKSGLPEEVKYANSILEFDGILRSLDVGQAIVSNTESDRALLLDIRPRLSVHGGF